jgi:hypothetical protein
LGRPWSSWACYTCPAHSKRDEVSASKSLTSSGRREALRSDWEAAAQLLTRDLQETGSSSWCSRCSMCVDTGKQRGRSDQGRDERDGEEVQSCVPRTRVRPPLPLYLAPLGRSAKKKGFSANWKSLSLSFSVGGAWCCIVEARPHG